MELNECFRKGFIKKTRMNLSLINSLMEMSDIAEDAVNNAKIDGKNISAYVSMAYESLREILEAICISREYHVISHLCLGELLKTLIDDFDYAEFDRMRYARNGVNYYGTKIEFDQGKEMIGKIFSMKKRLKEGYLKHIK